MNMPILSQLNLARNLCGTKTV